MKFLILAVIIGLTLNSSHAFSTFGTKSSALSGINRKFHQESKLYIQKSILKHPAAIAATNLIAHNEADHSKIYLQLIKFLPVLKSVLDPTVAGGLLAGGLHAVTGPDHLAALLPNSVGKSMWVGAKVGAIWGLGHGLSAIVLGLCAFFLKGKLTGRFSILHKLTYLAEHAVGASLVLIGLLGVKESLEPDEHQHEENGEVKTGKKTMSSGAIFANGVLHGFSWDGAPSIAPAVAMTSWRAAIYFLFAYSLGTVITMSISACTIGALSSKLGKMSQAPDFPKKLSLYSSLIAVLIGIYWIAQGFF